MSSFKLSTQAEQDLEDIWTYIAQDSEQAADALIDEIIQRFPKLVAFPDMGRKRDDLLEGLRSLPVKSYVLFYRRTQEGIEIFRILHGRRDIEGEFESTSS
ncbi:MAG: type II toxin-antitoxin system RelE/ParE family toxin [Coleofasciculaceae cyanobacterium]